MPRTSLKPGQTLNLPVAAAAVLCLCMVGGADVDRSMRAVAADSRALASLVNRFAEAARQVRPQVKVAEACRLQSACRTAPPPQPTPQHQTAPHLPPLRAALLNLPPPFVA